MLFLIYALVAAIVIFLSIKAAEYVDLIDKTTSVSGAFLGGILLSAVTSLPELLTSLSATLGLNEPGLAIGNILGSNLFNMTVLAILITFGIKTYQQAKIASSYRVTTLILCIIYGILLLNATGILDFQLLTISITSLLVFGLYLYSLKMMGNDDTEEEGEEDEETIVTSLTLKQIMVRFAFTSIGLVVFSIVITYITDAIAIEYNLGTGIAGALFLGIATSLPEVTSCISLVKRGNFNIAVGSIVGSNMFNFLVLFIADFFYTKESMYVFNDLQTKNLLFFGAIATPLMYLLLKKQASNSYRFIVLSLGIVTCYVLFLAI